jgi:hypothetical protein
LVKVEQPDGSVHTSVLWMFEWRDFTKRSNFSGRILWSVSVAPYLDSLLQSTLWRVQDLFHISNMMHFILDQYSFVLLGFSENFFLFEAIIHVLYTDMFGVYLGPIYKPTLLLGCCLIHSLDSRIMNWYFCI